MVWSPSASGSVGVSAAAFLPALTRALATTGVTGVTAATFRPATVYQLTTSALVYVGYPYYTYILQACSLGITWNTATASCVRELHGTQVYEGYNYTTNQYIYGYLPWSLGVSGPTLLSVNRSISIAEFTGIDSLLFEPGVVRSVAATGSVGITADANPNFGWVTSASGTLGISGSSRISRLYVVSASGSVGVTSLNSPKLTFVPASALGMLGISFAGALNISRSGVVPVSLGLTGSVRVNITPSTSLLNAIYLFEATDTQSPSTFGALLARDYQEILLDQTVSSYPQPFTLLN